MATKYICDICCKEIDTDEKMRQVRIFTRYTYDTNGKTFDAHNTCLPEALRTEYVAPVRVNEKVIANARTPFQDFIGGLRR